MKPKGKFQGFHHFYAGFVLAFIGWFLAWWGRHKFWRWVVMFGIAVAIDDVIQHFWHVATPLVWLNDWLWQFEIYRNIVLWFDKLF